MSSTLLKLLIFCSLTIIFAASIAHLSEAELRKGINVALTWKKLSFEQRREMIQNMLQMQNFGLKLRNELINAITTSRVMSKDERKELIKLMLIKAKFHDS